MKKKSYLTPQSKPLNLTSISILSLSSNAINNINNDETDGMDADVKSNDWQDEDWN